MLTRRRLPHLNTTGEPGFVTFRLHDSLPAHRSFRDGSLTSGRAFVAMDRVLDTARTGPLFLCQPSIAQILVDSLHCGEDIGHYDLHSWVVMPNHVHMLITPQVSLSKLLGTLKGVTAKKASVLLGRTREPFWQDESFDRIVRNADEFRRITRYIESNPVTACLVAAPEMYEWSSVWRSGGPPQAGGPPPIVPRQPPGN